MKVNHFDIAMENLLGPFVDLCANVGVNPKVFLDDEIVIVKIIRVNKVSMSEGTMQHGNFIMKIGLRDHTEFRAQINLRPRRFSIPISKWLTFRRFKTSEIDFKNKGIKINDSDEIHTIIDLDTLICEINLACFETPEHLETGSGTGTFWLAINQRTA